MTGNSKISPGIGGECPHAPGRNPDDCDSCWRDADNIAEIASLNESARTDLAEAERRVSRTRSDIAELVSSRVYDIELAEGTSGADALAELDRALLSLRHVRRILGERKRLLDGARLAHGGRASCTDEDCEAGTGRPGSETLERMAAYVRETADLIEAQAAELAPCGCPKKDGMIRHRRSSCTDPVVARLDWYADHERGQS